MNAKEFLMQYRHAKVKAELLQQQVDNLKERRDELQGFQVEERVQSSPKQDKIGELIANMTDLQLELMDAEAEALQIMLVVCAVINKVSDPTLQLLLHRRYIRLQKWSIIASDMHYSYTGVMAVHKRALAEVDKLI